MASDPERLPATATTRGRFRHRHGGGSGAGTLLRAGRYEVSRGWRIPLRITEFQVLFVCVRGRLRFLVGGSEHLLSAGSVLWLPRHRAHTGTAPYAGSAQVFVLHFSLPPADHPALPDARLWQLTEQLAGVSAQRCERLVSALEQGTPSEDLRADADLNLLLADLLDRPAQVGSAPPDVEPAGRSGDIARVLDHIAQHTDEPLRTTDLAAIAGLHRGHFGTVFAELTGLSPGQYVIAARVARARELLEYSTLPLEAIAERCGFSSASHLTRRFKEYEGMPPGLYRERHGRPRSPLGLTRRSLSPSQDP